MTDAGSANRPRAWLSRHGLIALAIGTFGATLHQFSPTGETV
jgi:hypothetical protein